MHSSVFILFSLLLPIVAINELKLAENDAQFPAAMYNITVNSALGGTTVNRLTNQILNIMSTDQYGISFSAVLKYSNKILVQNNNCIIKNATSNQQLMTLYDFIANNINTIVYDCSLIVDCSNNGMATNILILVQSGLAARQFKYYMVYDHMLPIQTPSASNSSIGMTLITRDQSDVHINSVKFQIGNSLSYCSGLPSCVTKSNITKSSILPIYIPKPSATTFFMKNVQATIVASDGYNKLVSSCDKLTTVKQTSEDMPPYTFPENASNSFSYTDDTFKCQWRIVPLNYNYYAKISIFNMMGETTSLEVQADNGFKYYYSPGNYSSSSHTDYDGYRGPMALSPVLLLTPGYITLTSNRGRGMLQFTVHFIRINTNITYVPYTADSRSRILHLTNNSNHAYLFAPKNFPVPYVFNNPRIMLLGTVTPQQTLLATYFDQCFLTTYNSPDASGPVLYRYNLNEILMFKKPIVFKSATTLCTNSISLSADILVRVGNADVLNSYNAAAFRVRGDSGSSGTETIRYKNPSVPTTGTQFLTISENNPSMYSTQLKAIISNHNSAIVKVHNGSDSDFVQKSLTPSSQDLPWVTPGSLVTYEFQSTVLALDVGRRYNSASSYGISTALLMLFTYILH